jgi:tetratricopeptide (TPR) repeat protein
VYTYHLALDYHRRKDYEQAISWYRKALQADASYEKAVFPLALALAESGKAVQKDAIWQKLNVSQKAYFGEEPAANDRLLSGLEAAKKQQWDVAEKHFQALVDDSSTSAYARATAHDYLGRAVLRRDAAAVESALQHWRQAYDAGLRSPALIENIGLAFATRIENLLVTEQINAATELAQAANKYAPNHPRLNEIQAYVLLRAGYQAATAHDWETALEHWQAITNAEGDIARRLAADMALAYEKLEMWEQPFQP